MNTKWFSVGCEGRTDLIMDKYTIGTASSSKTDRPSNKVDLAHPREAASRSLWIADDDETVVIPRETIHRCIIEAGKFFKYKGRKQFTTGDSSILPGIIEWGPDEAFVLDYPTWEVDVRGARVASGQRQDKFRPIFPSWGFAFEVGIDADEIHPSVFRDIVDAAGRRVGIGSMRPERKGLYGQFRVVKWEELDGPASTETPLRCKRLLESLLNKSGTAVAPAAASRKKAA